jgi:cytochrome c oxidase subunit II
MPFFRGTKRLASMVSLVILSSLLFAACDSSPSILDPKGTVAHQESDLFWIMLGLSTFVFVAVEGWLIFAIVRYRSRPNTPEPRQIHGNNTVELIWTIAPAIVLFILLAFTIKTMFALAEPSASNTIEVQAIGHQWWWEFRYVNYGLNGNNTSITTADSLYVPPNTNVHVDLISDNVIHSFWIPALTGKTDVIPGHTNTLWFSADTPGVYRGECAEYCGTQHAHMDFDVVVFNTGDQFNTWVSGQQALAATPAGGSLAAQGEAIFKGAGGCTGCHGIVGVDIANWNATTTTFGIPVSSLKGPNLTHFGARHLIAGGILATTNSGLGANWSNDPACQIVNNQVRDPANCGLYQWLMDPQGVKPGNDMIIGQLTPAQVNQLIAYLESLQ